MTKFWLLFNIAIFIYSWPHGRSERIHVLEKDTDDFDFDGMPGAQHEFKFEVAAGEQECFYQGIVSGGTLHVSFEVMRGGDGNVALVLTKADNTAETLHKIDPKGRGAFEYGPVTENGVHAICIDNTNSRMASKLVYLFIVTHVEAEWSKYIEEVRSVRLQETSFKTSLQIVEESLTQTFVQQVESRMHVVKDWYLITGNMTYIQMWSIGECLVIIICSGIQVYFVRRLFRGYNVTPSSR